jgi:hypothetical protein
VFSNKIVLSFCLKGERADGADGIGLYAFPHQDGGTSDLQRLGHRENGGKCQTGESWFTERDAKYPASLRGTWGECQSDPWQSWHQRCIPKCIAIIECTDYWAHLYWERQAAKAVPDTFFPQWCIWNRFRTPEPMTDGAKRRYRNWILGYEPIPKSFFSVLFSRYAGRKGYECARVGVEGGFVVMDTVGWLKDEKKIAKIRDWLILNQWQPVGTRFRTPLTAEWTLVMDAARDCHYEDVFYDIFIENIEHKAL